MIMMGNPFIIYGLKCVVTSIKMCEEVAQPLKIAFCKLTFQLSLLIKSKIRSYKEV